MKRSLAWIALGILFAYAVPRLWAGRIDTLEGSIRGGALPDSVAMVVLHLPDGVLDALCRCVLFAD